jgi:hypothetical protein
MQVLENGLAIATKLMSINQTLVRIAHAIRQNGRIASIQQRARPGCQSTIQRSRFVHERHADSLSFRYNNLRQEEYQVRFGFQPDFWILRKTDDGRTFVQSARRDATKSNLKIASLKPWKSPSYRLFMTVFRSSEGTGALELIHSIAGPDSNSSSKWMMLDFLAIPYTPTFDEKVVMIPIKKCAMVMEEL